MVLFVQYFGRYSLIAQKQQNFLIADYEPSGLVRDFHLVHRPAETKG